VRERQDEVLGERVDERERQLVMVVAPVDRVVLEVRQRVVHPAHVPLEAEAEAAQVGRPRHPRPRGRLLGRGDDAGLARVQDLVELLQERDRVEVLAAAELVRHPLALLARVVEVEHRRHGVDADAVDVVLAHPEQRVGDQEVPHLVAPEVEHQRAPVRVRAAPRVGVLVQRGSVEARQRELVAREVRRHPVEDHAEPVAVQAVDELAEVVRRAEARRRRVVAGHLVAPGAAERVVHDRQQLEVGEAHVLRVGGELVGQLEIGQRAAVLERIEPPRAEVDLVDRHRLVERRRRVAPLEPLRVAPLVLRLVHDRGGLRRLLGLERVRVGLVEAVAVRPRDLVLVVRAPADLGHEQLPDAARAERAHRMQPAVPPVEVADHRDRLRGRRPDRERRAPHALVLHHVRAEPGVDLLVAALARQVQVELTDGRREAIGVLDPERPAGVRPVVDLELVDERQLRLRHHALEQPVGVGRLELGNRLVLHVDRHRLGRRPDRADDDTAVVGQVGAAEGVRVRAHDPPFDSSSRTMPATGMATQSGRLLSS
jgi:hypothetical protein